MFKKINSKRDPNVTLWAAIRSEFGAYFERAGSCFGGFCARYPKGIFLGMVLLLLLSAALSFTLFRSPDRRPAAHAALPQKQAAGRGYDVVFGDGFARILGTGAALQQTLFLRKRLEGLLAKDHLSAADSAALGKALDSLQALQQQLQKR